MQLRPQIVPARLQDVPVPFIISAFKDDGMDMDAGSLSGRTRLLPLYHFFLPQTADAVHPADLLFHHARVPFWMQQNHRAAGGVQIEPFSPHQRLGH